MAPCREFVTLPQNRLDIVLTQDSETSALIAAFCAVLDLNDPALERELLGFAQRARTATRGQAPTLVREAMLVLGKWAGAIGADCWRKREERAARLLDHGICGRAVVTLLPTGIRYEVESLSPLHDWASVSVPELDLTAQATAHSVAAALLSALFQLIAQAFRLTAKVPDKEDSPSAVAEPQVSET